ncbi:MAG: hypothetical protein J6T10_21860 [Methanobrevibacter sp.]|nr:hypothetical protein [Methanobrevibacter sp.]
MISIYDVKKSEMLTHPNGEVFYLCELRGLSTDVKPKSIKNGSIENGSSFIEIDTGDIYLYDLANEEWNNLNSGDTPSEETPSEETLQGEEK